MSKPRRKNVIKETVEEKIARRKRFREGEVITPIILKKPCPDCKGWGHKWIKAGIPNETQKCRTCKGTGEG